MSRLRNVSIATKIIACTVGVLAISAAVVSVNLSTLSTARSRITQIDTQGLAATRALSQAQQSLLSERIYILSYVSSHTAQSKQTNLDALAKARTTTDAALTEVATIDGAGRYASTLAQVKSELATYRTLIDGPYRQAADTGDSTTLDSLRDNQASPQMKKIVADLATIADNERSSSDALVAATDRGVGQGVSVAVVGLLLAIGFGAAMCAFIVSGIRTSMRRVMVTVEKVGAGDLTARARVTTGDEMGAIGTGLDGALDSLQQAMSGTAASVEPLRQAAQRLTSDARDVSRSTTSAAEQATSVSAGATEVSAAVGSLAAGAEEMSASIAEIANGAAAASTTAAQAVTDAHAADTAMVRLSDSSAKITAIVSLIQKIAEQTNLLALNATIEAARAGESGKGFAVVAGEVKDLARQTASATQEITHQVAAIQSDAASASSAIAEIVSTIEKVNDHQSTIASAVEEQTATTSEMARAVQDSAAGAAAISGSVTLIASTAADASRQLAGALEVAEQMQHLSAQFSDTVSRFTLV